MPRDERLEELSILAPSDRQSGYPVKGHTDKSILGDSPHIFPWFRYVWFAGFPETFSSPIERCGVQKIW